MEKYRVCFERVFPANSGRAYLPDGRDITAVMVDFQFILYSRITGSEVFFYGDPEAPPSTLEAVVTKENGTYEHLNRFFTCHFDREHGYRLKQVYDGMDKTVVCSPLNECGCLVGEAERLEVISLKTALKTLKAYPEAFEGDTDNSFSSSWQFFCLDTKTKDW